MSTLASFIIYIFLIYNVQSLELCPDDDGLKCQTVLINGQENSRIIDIGQNEQTIDLKLDADLETTNVKCELINEKTEVELEVQNEMELKLPNIEFVGQLKCYIGDKDYASNDKILLTNFSKIVQHTYEETFEFVANETNEQKLIVTFTFPLSFDFFTENSAFCLVDKNLNLTVKAIYQDSNSIVCDLSIVNLTGQHSLYVVRSLELLNSTLTYQHPISIIIQNTTKSSAHIDDSKIVQVESIQFNDQLTNLLLQLDDSIEECSSIVSCEFFFVDVSQFEYCLVENDTVTVGLLKSEQSLRNSTKVRSQLSKYQCQLSVNNLNDQQVVDLPIENATNPITPQGKIIQNQMTLQFAEEFGCGYQQCSCQWTLLTSESDGSFAQSSNCTIYLSTMELKMPINIELEICNFAGICSSISQQFNFYNNLIVDIVGASDHVFANQKLTLYPRITPSQNEEVFGLQNFKFTWLVNYTIASKFSSLIIKPNTYEPGQSINVILDVQKFENQSISGAMGMQTIKFDYQPIVVEIDSIERSIEVDELLTIDASKSYDPNNPSLPLTHRWSCTDLTSQKLCDLPENNGILTIPANYLTQDHRYLLTDTIASNTQMTNLNVQVSVNAPNFPTIQLANSNMRLISSTDYLKAKALIEPNDVYLTLNWTVVEKSTNKIIIDSTNFPKSTRSYQNIKPNKTITFSLSIAPNQLSLNANQIYLVRLTAENSYGSSFIDYELNTTESNSQVFVTPSNQIYALTTPTQLTLLQSNRHPEIKIRFGFRAFTTSNSTVERWFVATESLKHHLFLPATNQPNKSCSSFTSFVALAEICQANGACLTVKSSNFSVQKAPNITESIVQLNQLINYDLQSELPFDAFEKFDALHQETCAQNFDLCDSIASKMIDQLGQTKEMNELVGGMHYLTNIIGENMCSVKMMPNLLQSIGTIRSLMLHNNPIKLKTNRQKRSMDLVSALSGGDANGVSESIAGTLLVAYDLLVSKNQNVVTVYLSNLIDLLSGFCTQTDSTKTFSATGQNYTTIQLQGLIPSYKSFLSATYSLAGTNGKTIVFDKGFQQAYGRWLCSDKAMNCSEICLGTAQVKFSVLQANEYMAAYFATSSFNAVGLNELVSDLYEIVFMDPLSGKQVFLTNNVGYTIRIPMLTYKSAYYYKCFTFTGNSWTNNYCRSGNYGISLDSNITGLECTCNSGGFLGVFMVSNPSPPYYPQYNEINITMKLTTTSQCSSNDAKTFVLALTQATNLEKSRFVNTSCSAGGWLTTILRPAFRQNQTSNSYAMQSVKKALLAPSGFIAYDTISVFNLTDTIINRNLSNDGNARRVCLRIDRSYKDIVGNDSTILAQTWLSSISSNMRISPYRFKNPVLAMGMVFNFTITLPFSGEPAEENKLSAEEIASWIQEQTVYGELDLRDSQNDRMPIDVMNAEEDIIELVVVTHVTSLMVVLASVVTMICILSSFCIGGLVFVKIRTDRLIEKHNRNMQPLDISHSIPMTVFPFESQPLQVNTMNAEEEAHLDYATNTVVFGKHQ